MHSSGVSFFSISRDHAQLVAQFKTTLQQGRRRRACIAWCDAVQNLC
jgi:hypothetical protein